MCDSISMYGLTSLSPSSLPCLIGYRHMFYSCLHHTMLAMGKEPYLGSLGSPRDKSVMPFVDSPPLWRGTPPSNLEAPQLL